jgi:hypothetical protein
MAIAHIRRIRQGRLFGILFVSAIVAPPLVVTGLYSTQNYYPAALSPAVAALMGLGISWAWERRRRLVARIGLISAVALWVMTLWLTRDYWLDAYRPVVDRDGSLAAAAFIRERTAPGGWVVVDGRHWDPTVLYYAERRGYMMDPRRASQPSVEDLLQNPRYTLAVRCPYERVCEVLAGGDD